MLQVTGFNAVLFIKKHIMEVVIIYNANIFSGGFMRPALSVCLQKGKKSQINQQLHIYLFFGSNSASHLFKPVFSQYRNYKVYMAGLVW